jgi:hypothetical protein
MTFRISIEEKKRRRNHTLAMLMLGRNLEERLKKHIEIDANGCWIWTGYRDSCGYGSMSVLRGKPVRAHTVAYFLRWGTIPEAGRQLDHLICDNPSCCNPEHTKDSTARENVLRTCAPSAINAQKDHCPKGHPYDEENTCRSGGGRYCRACAREKANRLGPIIYARMREKGICVVCQSAPAAPNRVSCLSCLAKNAARMQKSH